MSCFSEDSRSLRLSRCSCCIVALSTERVLICRWEAIVEAIIEAIVEAVVEALQVPKLTEYRQSVLPFPAFACIVFELFNNPCFFIYFRALFELVVPAL